MNDDHSLTASIVGSAGYQTDFHFSVSDSDRNQLKSKPARYRISQSRSLSCFTSGRAGRSGEQCPWLGAQPLLGASAISVRGYPASGAGPNWPSDDGDHGAPAVGGRLPVNPVPGPAPGGVSGGSASGASGFGLSAFVTLAGLLLLAAPRALRRLRLLCQPLRTACFVLIPEHPD